MKELKNLLQVKKIISIMVTGVFCVGFFTKRISAEQFSPIAIMVLGYYFGQSTARQAGKGE